MMPDHAEYIRQATELAHIKRYDDARELALRVIREDGCNVSALWLIACVTNSLNERRNALKALLRIQPSNLPACQMLSETEQQFGKPGKATTNVPVKSVTSRNVVRSIKPE
jgi:hypothetical protein